MVNRHYRYGKQSLVFSRTRLLGIEQLESRYLLDAGGVTLVDDLYDLPQNGPRVTLDLLANDQFDDNYGGTTSDHLSQLR